MSLWNPLSPRDEYNDLRMTSHGEVAPALMGDLGADISRVARERDPSSWAPDYLAGTGDPSMLWANGNPLVAMALARAGANQHNPLFGDN